MWSRSRIVSTILAVLIAGAGAGCELVPGQSQAIEDAFTFTAPPPVPEPVPAPPPPENPAERVCSYDRFQQPAGLVTNKVDLLFVVDTSGSLDEERAGIGDGIDGFVAALPPSVDYRIGVMLAHSGHSSHGGKLYKRSGNPWVLDSQSLTLDQIRTKLRNTLGSPPGENRTDGGEVGLLSLDLALDHGSLSSIRAKGLFREDAALVVVFIADENDICARYPEGVVPVPDPNGLEIPAMEDLCTRHVPAQFVDGNMVSPAHDQEITPEILVGKLRALQGDLPLLVSGILYNDSATMPVSGENEFGYGYAETVALSNGVTVDMATGSHSGGMAQIGWAVTYRLALQTEFPVSRPAEEVDPASFQVFVDASPVPFLYSPEFNEVQIAAQHAGGALSTVDVTYCEPVVPPPPPPEPPPGVSDTCLAGAENPFVPPAVVRVGLSIDPNEGSMNTIVAGLTALGYPPTVYTDAQVASGLPAADGVTTLIVARKILLQPVSSAYVAGIRSFVAGGGSILGEYDGAALMFNAAGGGQAAIQHLMTQVALFDGLVQGGGALIPREQGTTYVTDPLSPLTAGLPSQFLSGGFRAGFAVTGYSGNWLSKPAEFINNTSLNPAPAGSYPAALAGRCGQGRVALLFLTYLHATGDASVGRLVSNALGWLSGQ